MKLIKVLSMVSVVCVASCQKNAKPVTAESLKTEIDSVSYAAGVSIGKSLQNNFLDINKDLFTAGYMHVIDSMEVLMDDEGVQKAIQAYMAKNQGKIMEKQKALQAKRLEEEFGHIKEEGEKFLAENKTKEGMMVTESGLQYTILKEGDGEKPTAADKVKVHYHGTLVDGTVFDSSVDRGEPTEFGVGQVIKGWTEGLQLMSVGSKYKFFIPQELAYGANPRGGQIKPFSMLIFEVELLDIIKKEE
ncbi:hypothetical protein MHTCC0001_13640 [Flavobacteriaceae bacterium MHTCC 0001]